MVGESSSRTPERNTQYIYSEGSWEPLARVDSIGEQSDIFWYHTELNGLPERMTDERGEVVWRGRFSTWSETEQESAMGSQTVPQNLRFRGAEPGSYKWPALKYNHNNILSVQRGYTRFE